MWKESILLRFVEAVDFVHEDDRTMAGAGFLLGHGHNFLDFLDTREDGAERNELRTGQSSDKPRKRGFPAAGWSPEEHRAEIVAFNLNAKWLTRSKKFFLPDEFIECPRAHALRERLVRGGHIRLGHWRRQFGKEAHGVLDVCLASGVLAGNGEAGDLMPGAGVAFLCLAAS